MYIAFFTLITALLISSVAAYFSVTGLAALFSASYWAIVIMAGSIELGKICTATWLKANWSNPLVSKIHKFYLVVALLITMSVTSLGIFGFLSRSHFEQNAPIQKDLVKIESVNAQIDLKKQELAVAYKQLEQLDKSITPGQSQPTLERERRTLQTYIQKLNNEIQSLSTNIEQNKENVGQKDIELGPAKYLAGLIFKDPAQSIDKAIQIVICMIMLTFDPLALSLLIAAQISFNQIRDKRLSEKKYKSDAMHSIHETIEGLHETGVVDSTTMEEFDQSCLEPESIPVVQEERKVMELNDFTDKDIELLEQVVPSVEAQTFNNEVVQEKPLDDDSFKGIKISKHQDPTNWA